MWFCLIWQNFPESLNISGDGCRWCQWLVDPTGNKREIPLRHQKMHTTPSWMWHDINEIDAINSHLSTFFLIEGSVYSPSKWHSMHVSCTCMSLMERVLTLLCSGCARGEAWGGGGIPQYCCRSPIAPSIFITTIFSPKQNSCFPPPPPF